MRKIHYFKTPLIKMGRWNVSPADSETWHGIETSRYFKKVFGIYKGTLVLHTLFDDGEHGYFPKAYFVKLFKRIDQINKNNYKNLEKILIKFYPFKLTAKKALAWSISKNLKQISVTDLIKMYKNNRSWVHRLTVYDQFGWIGEDYWKQKMETILIKKYKFIKNSPEYYRVLFTLSKPEKISTTLEEKMSVLKMVLGVLNNKISIKKASEKLTSQFGWLPVAAYGTPWNVKHYQNELQGLIGSDINKLRNEYETLKNYSIIRNAEVREVVKTYKIAPRHLQVFIDFGLVLDLRNEAEYLVSFGGFYLLPIYNEIARRLALSVRKVRNLYEDEMIAALQSKIDPLDCLHKKGKIIGWGYNEAMTKRINFTTEEATALFKKIEKITPLIQGSKANAGICASPGVVAGKVKVVHSPAENYKVKHGDIMIAHTTMVDFLPAMKNAAAIVTEVGGLTCHAAVVSREFGIPCVVGYKNAIKLFRDGQKVRVNANNGSIVAI